MLIYPPTRHFNKRLDHKNTISANIEDIIKCVEEIYINKVIIITVLVNNKQYINFIFKNVFIHPENNNYNYEPAIIVIYSILSSIPID